MIGANAASVTGSKAYIQGKVINPFGHGGKAGEGTSGLGALMLLFLLPLIGCIVYCLCKQQ